MSALYIVDLKRLWPALPRQRLWHISGKAVFLTLYRGAALVDEGKAVHVRTPISASHLDIPGDKVDQGGWLALAKGCTWGLPGCCEGMCL